MKNYRLLKGFTIPEALILLVVATLVGAALLPAVTIKHRKVAPHGKWVCTVDKNGTHWVQTTYNGKESTFKSTGNKCTFTPPANAKSFQLKAVAGGGAGAGGQMGDDELLFASNGEKDSYVEAVEKDGFYTIFALGAGGGGGGMGCGEAKDWYTKTVDAIKPKTYISSAGAYAFISTMPSNDWTWNTSYQRKQYENELHTRHKVNKSSMNYAHESYRTKDFTYGYVDFPLSAFNYDYLIKNDSRFTQDSTESKVTVQTTGKLWTDKLGNERIYDMKYKYLDESYQRKNLCFASDSNIPPMSKEYTRKPDNKNIKGLYQQYSNGKQVCWNLPGEGGHVGAVRTVSRYLSAGDSVVANVGRGGKGQFASEAGAAGSVYNTVKLFKPETNSLTSYTLLRGKEGLDGTDTAIYVGGEPYIGKGGTGGYGRVIQNVVFKNIPVNECPVKMTTGTFANNSSCGSYSGWDASGSQVSRCKSTPGCTGSRNLQFYNCTGSSSKCYGRGEASCKAGYDEEVTNPDGTKSKQHYNCTANYEYNTSCSTNGYHSGPAYSVDMAGCRTVVRGTYFSVPACVNTREGSMKFNESFGDKEYAEMTSDQPYLYGTTKYLKRFWVGDVYNEDKPDPSKYTGPEYKYAEEGFGSGAYGIGETIKSYFDYEPGEEVSKPRFRGWDGDDGFATVNRISYAAGGGGQAGQYINTLLNKTGKLTITVGKGGTPGTQGVMGDKGGDTVIDSSVSGNIVTLRGGQPGIEGSTNAEYATAGYLRGVNGSLSPFEMPYNKAKVIPYGGKTGTNTKWDGYSPATPKWQPVSGNYSGPLATSYGAGGGGGAASKTQAGVGGFGAAGAVIIEW